MVGEVYPGSGRLTGCERFAGTQAEAEAWFDERNHFGSHLTAPKPREEFDREFLLGEHDQIGHEREPVAGCPLCEERRTAASTSSGTE